jgi:hypothetical protein
VSGGAGAAPPPKTTAPASWRLALPWVSPAGAGWWVVGDRGHRKGQLPMPIARRAGARQLGSPSALHTKFTKHQGTQDRGTTGGGRGGADPVVFCESPLALGT